MVDKPVEKRVTELEDLLSEVLQVQETTERELDQLSREVRIFKDKVETYIANNQAEREQSAEELRVFKDKVEMYVADNQAAREQSARELREFKAEMLDFKEEMRSFKAESNQNWGFLANRLGTLAEDLVAPSIPRIMNEIVGCPGEKVDYLAVRVRRTHAADRSRSQEFDVVAVCGNTLLISETKSRLNPEDVDEFVKRMREAREFFPEYATKKIIGAIAGLYVYENMVRYGQRAGLLVLGLGENLMDVLNAPGFEPFEF